MLALRACIAILSWFAIEHSCSWAETIPLPSQVTPQNFSMMAPKAAGHFQFPQPASNTPSANAQLEVIVDDIKIEGGFGDNAQTAQALAIRYKGRKIKIADVYALANEIEQIYIKKGYVLVRAGIPQQEVKDHGTLRIAVVNGFIQKIEIKDIPERVRNVVLARTQGLIGQKSILLLEIERRLLLAGEAPGLRLKSALSAGDTEGGVTLILEGQHDPVNGSVMIDNRLPQSLGRWQTTTSATLNSYMGYGEQFYASAGVSGIFDQRIEGGLSSVPLKLIAVGVTIPIGIDGLTINPEYSISVTHTPVIGRSPETSGVLDHGAFRLSYPWIKTRETTVNLKAIADYYDQRQMAPSFATNLSYDRYAAARLESDVTTTLFQTIAFTSNFILSQGLGGRDASDAAKSHTPLSHQGAEPDFQKLSVNARFSVPVIENVHVNILTSAQTSFGASLFRSEQLALDDVQSLSSFDSGALNVDQGVTGRAELARPTQLSIEGYSLNLEPYVFAAIGKGFVEHATAVETSVVDANDLGIGIRSFFGGINPAAGTSTSIEIGHGRSNVEGQEKEWRAVFSTRVNF